MLLLLAGSMFIMSGLSGMRLGKQVYNMAGAARLDHSGIAIPGSVSTSTYVTENWMYPAGLASLCVGFVTTMAAGVVTVGQRARKTDDR